MGNAGETATSESFEELVEQTRGPRARIINWLQFYGGEAHGQQLRREGDIPSGRYHFNKLQEQGVIEKVGTEHVGKGGEASVYRLTDLGREVVDARDESPDVEGTIVEIENRLDQQAKTSEETQNEIETLQHRYDAIADFVEELDDRIDEFEERLDDAGL